MRSSFSTTVSLVGVMSEMIGGASVVVISRVINVLAVSLLIWVLLCFEIGIVGEEETIPCAVLLVFRILLVTERLIVSLQHSALSQIHRLSWDHCREGSQIRARVPAVILLALFNSVPSEGHASNEACAKEIPSECLSGKIAGIEINEIVNHALLRYNGNTTLISLSTASNPNGKRSCHKSSNNGIGPESELVLVLGLSLVFPGPTLGIGHILSES